MSIQDRFQSTEGSIAANQRRVLEVSMRSMPTRQDGTGHPRTCGSTRGVPSHQAQKKLNQATWSALWNRIRHSSHTFSTLSLKHRGSANGPKGRFPTRASYRLTPRSTGRLFDPSPPRRSVPGPCRHRSPSHRPRWWSEDPPDLGQPQVHQHDASIVFHENVAGFDIPMNHAVGMQKVQRPQYRRGHKITSSGLRGPSLRMHSLSVCPNINSKTMYGRSPSTTAKHFGRAGCSKR